jgi:hypothetical protein
LNCAAQIFAQLQQHQHDLRLNATELAALESHQKQLVIGLAGMAFMTLIRICTTSAMRTALLEDFESGVLLEQNESAWSEYHDKKLSNDLKGKYDSKRSEFAHAHFER